jgi:LysR family transcriptional regulator (chromosome initiation inhibitor)
MLDYAQLNALSAVLRNGSFEGAAAELSVTPSAISQRIRALEERMGTVLVERGQPCLATDAGARLARHVEDVRLLEQHLEASLGTAPRGNLAPVRMAVNADSLATWFLPALAETQGLLFDIEIDDQEHSEARLRRGAVAAAVTAHRGPVQGCDSHALGALRYVATAAPDFVARWCPDGATAAALARAPGLTFNQKDRLQAIWLQRRAGRRIGYRSHMLASSQGFVEAALLGMGWGMNPELLVRDYLDTGQLVALGPEASMDVPLFWQVSRAVAPALAPLTRAVRRAATAALIG